MIKVWLDDIRPAPDNSWIKVTDTGSCLNIIFHNKVEILSLDHDLGSEDCWTGYDLLNILEEAFITKKYGDFYLPITILVHSDNPVGRQKMLQAIQSINRRRNI